MAAGRVERRGRETWSAGVRPKVTGVVRGIQIEDIASAARRKQHAPTPWARVEALRIVKPTESLSLG